MLSGRSPDLRLLHKRKNEHVPDAAAEKTEQQKGIK
jgi:hypothetical protein